MMDLRKAVTGLLPRFKNSNTTPPPYNHEAQLSDKEVDDIVKDYDILRQQSPNGSMINLHFHFTPLRLYGDLWDATLDVRAKNITEVMRDGFHWGIQNVLPTGSSISLYTTENSKLHEWDPWKHKRSYTLKSHTSTSGTGPEWEAVLEVFTVKESTVLDFDLSWITLDTTYSVSAWGLDRKLIYFARAGARGRGTYRNTLLRDRPMDGWWPAPKKKGDPRPKGWRRARR